jgi:hypothetical protein
LTVRVIGVGWGKVGVSNFAVLAEVGKSCPICSEDIMLPLFEVESMLIWLGRIEFDVSLLRILSFFFMI